MKWAHRAYPHLGDVSSITELKEKAAEGTEESPKTAEKWLEERNPLYEPHASTNAQKLGRFEQAVRIAVAYFTGSP